METAGTIAKEERGWDRWLELIWATALSDFRRRYAGSALGLTWSLVEPVMLSGILYLVFTRVVRFGGAIDHYTVMLLLNVILFRFFRTGTQSAMRALITKKGMVKSVRFPRVTMPLAAILTTALFLGINLVVVFGWVLGDGIKPMLTWLLFPVLIAYLLIATTSLGLVLAAFCARWRDTEYFWRSTSRLLFYASPVIYPFELIRGELFRTLAACNPLCPLFVEAREWIIDPSAPNWIEAAGSTPAAVIPFVVLSAWALAAATTFRPLTRRVAESL